MNRENETMKTINAVWGISIMLLLLLSVVKESVVCALVGIGLAIVYLAFINLAFIIEQK